MNDFSLDKYLQIVNEEKNKKGLNNYAPLYPMLRIENDKLYIGVMLTKDGENVWDKDSQIKPEYWTLLDIDSNKIISFNKTSDNDFVIDKFINKNIDYKQKEISKYTIEKTLQYKNYLINDIKNEKLPFQKELSNIIGNEIEIDGEKININEYILSNMENEINDKIDELVKLLICSKYTTITFYYDSLFNQIISNYINNKTINKDQIKMCINIMNIYYDGVIGIDNFFNI